MIGLDKLTNLLPPERQSALRRTYFFRLATVALLALFVLLVVHAVMLVPTYAYLKEQIAVREGHLVQLTERLDASEEKEVDARLTALKEDAQYLLALSDAPSTSAALRVVLDVPRPGVRLSGFSYVPPAGAEPGTMTVRGVASTREALRNYHESLSLIPGMTSTDLPIGSYAEETDIAFTVTLAGSFTPASTP